MSYCSANLALRIRSYSSWIWFSLSLIIRSQIRPTCRKVKRGWSRHAKRPDPSALEEVAAGVPLELSELSLASNFSCFLRWSFLISSLIFSAICSDVNLEATSPKGDWFSVELLKILGEGAITGVHLRRLGLLPFGLWSGSHSQLLFRVAQAIFQFTTKKSCVYTWDIWFCTDNV